MSLTPEQTQALDSMPCDDALAYLASIHGGSLSGAIGVIAAACDFGQAEQAASSCVARVVATVPAPSEFPPGMNGQAITSAVTVLGLAAASLHSRIP